MKEIIRTKLGEGIFLDSSSETLFWVDINQSILFSCFNGCMREYQIPENISAVLSAKNGVVCLANRSGLINYHLALNSISQISRTPSMYSAKEYRANDGVKLGDRLYIYGVMRNKPVKNDGALIVSKNGVSKVVCTDISIPNTFIKVPNSQSLLITDSFDGVIYKITFNEVWFSILSKVKWFDLSHTNTTPDGGCITSDGRIFVAIWDGFKILELNLNGELVNEYRVPVPRPTNCTLNTEETQLFVTSAYEGLTEHDRQKYPLSGSIVTVDISVC